MVMQGNPVLQIKDLKKSFRGGRDQVLRGIFMDVASHSVTYLLGSSGSGKSVLLKHLVGLLTPDSGEVLVHGNPIDYQNGHKMNELRKSFGMLFQNSALFDDMTVYENISFPLVEHSHLSKKEIRSKVNDRLESVGLDPQVVSEKFPSEISGGMKRRVALARAIILEPSIILYDEPTTGLDPLTRNTVDELIVETNRKFGLTSIVVSHDMYAAIKWADAIAFLHKGEIAFWGTPSEFEQCEHPMVKGFLDAERQHIQKLTPKGSS